MKKLLLGILILVSVSINAQTMKGNWLMGGTAGFSSSKEDHDDAEALTTITLNPDLGYFLADNLAVGAAINFLSQSQGDGDHSEFGVGPFVRYYFLNIGESAKLFGHGQFTFGSSKTGDADAVSSTAWKIKAGLAWFLNNHVALEAALGYGSSKEGDTEIGGINIEHDATNTFGLEIGFQIHLGGE